MGKSNRVLAGFGRHWVVSGLDAADAAGVVYFFFLLQLLATHAPASVATPLTCFLFLFVSCFCLFLVFCFAQRITLGREAHVGP